MVRFLWILLPFFAACVVPEPRREVTIESQYESSDRIESTARPSNLSNAQPLPAVPAFPAPPANDASVDRAVDSARATGGVPAPTPVFWDIALFGPTSDFELEREARLYAELQSEWIAGDGVEAFRRLTVEIEAHPARHELRLLRAAVALDAVGALERPLILLEGRLTHAVLPPLPLLLFIVSEYQLAVPQRPPSPVPWTGLYHPYVFDSLLGETVTLWSHGLRSLVRASALAAGNLIVFEDFARSDASLIDRLVEAQLLAAQGKLTEARETLSFSVATLVASDFVKRWSGLRDSLLHLLERVATSSSAEAELLLNAWREAVVRSIPEARHALLSLPRAALDAAKLSALSPDAARTIPDVGSVSETLALITGQDRSTSDGATGEVERSALVEEFLETALCIRDFRADCLRRVQLGDWDGVLSRELKVENDFAFLERGSGRLAFIPSGPDRQTSLTAQWSIPCSDRASLLLQN